MWNGIAIGIGRQRFAGGFADSYSARVLANGGVIESLTCVANASTLLQQASWLLIPSGYKEDIVYAQKPSNGNGDLTWTRASDAFRTNANGQIQRVPWNLVTNSVLAGAVVGNPGTLPTGYVYGITSGLSARIESIGVENGLNYIDIRYTGTATSTVHTLDIPGTLPMVVGQDVTNSIYVKNVSNAPNISVRVIEINSSGGYVTEGGNSVTLTSNLTRYSYTKTVSGSTTTQVRISFYAFLSSGQTYDFTIRIAAPQMEAGSTASDFFPTTNRLDVPRLSYMYGSCPSLLLEPQRTNLVLYSEQFDNATWGKNNVSVSANSATAPDNTTTADLVTALATTSAHLLTNASHPATTVTASLYAKKNTHNFIQIFSGWASTAFANFDLNNGVVGSVGSGTIASIQSFGNGWYRCTITTNAIASSIVRWCLVSSSTAVYNESWTANGTESVYFWGAQLEVGSYATTYIPTTSATATRLADSFIRNNIYTNGLIGASGGTWFVELKNNVSYTRDAGSEGLFIGDTSIGSTNSLQIIAPIGGGRLRINKRIATIGTSLYNTLTDNVKIAIKWNGTTADVFVNGVKVVSATAFTTTNMEFLNGLSADAPKFIQAMALFNEPKSDVDCEVMTGTSYNSYSAMASALGYTVI